MMLGLSSQTGDPDGSLLRSRPPFFSLRPPPYPVVPGRTLQSRRTPLPALRPSAWRCAVKALLFFSLIASPLLVLSCDAQAPSEPIVTGEVIAESPTLEALRPFENIKPVCSPSAADRNGNGCFCRTHGAHPQCGGPLYFDDARDQACKVTASGQKSCRTTCRRADTYLSDGVALPYQLEYCTALYGQPRN